MTDTSSRRRRAGLAMVLLAGTSLGGLGFWAGDKAHAGDATPAIVAPAVSPANSGFADLVEKVRPAVVTITTTEPAKQNDDDSPFPFTAPQRRGVMHALGSGFIIDSEGHIVTNNHVVDGATSVKVTLDDGREMTAKVIGRDPRTDLALIQVKADKPLPFLSLGDSNKPRPGDWVVAVGNPFGLGGTVTAGVLSARGRDIGQGPYDDFLQIDAPINRGNSGGPLFSQDGKVIGVNTAIFSPSGGSVGIGFAIPSNMVKEVVAQIEANGHVERGFLGATTQGISPSMQQALNLPGHDGALIDEVNDDSPAARAGLQAGDVVVSLNGQPVKDQRTFARSIGALPPGSDITLGVVRDGAQRELHAKLDTLRDGQPQQADADDQTEGGRIGLALAPIDGMVRQQLHIGADVRGAVVAAVQDDSPAAHAGLRPGDVITSVGNHRVAGPEEAVRAIRQARHNPNTAVALRILRDGHNVFVAVGGPSDQG
ncbi:Do family serine endopeptidase [Acetobacteraceae bacterium H6797]|nr:Do family serine endopeptidase [Acetobacteraceae bacterium H6797]